MTTEAPLRTWTLSYAGRVPTTNKVARMHWSARNALAQEWEYAFRILALNARIPHLDRIALEVRPSVRDDRPPDPDASALVAKFALDGLVKARVVEDDGRGRVAYVRLWDPTTKSVDQIVIEVVEL